MIPIPNLPEWVNSKWFNTVTAILAVAGSVLAVVDAPWAPKAVAIIGAALGAFGLAIKPSTK